MLLLTRHVNDRTTITVPPSTTPTEITITQIDIRGDKSQLGFDAPREVLIMRDEVTKRSDAGG